jgi:hypothetical protein
MFIGFQLSREARIEEKAGGRAYSGILSARWSSMRPAIPVPQESAHRSTCKPTSYRPDLLTRLIHMTLTTTSPSFKSFSVGTRSDLSVLNVSGSMGPLGRDWRTIRVLVFDDMVDLMLISDLDWDSNITIGAVVEVGRASTCSRYKDPRDCSVECPFPGY